jgi:phosphatidylglycerol:prolipoprotein diacylglycerol transferase
MRKAKKQNVSPYDIIIVAATAMGIGLLCGGLLYTFVTYPLDFIIQQLKAGNWDIFGGGIVFYGGLIGGIFGGILGMRIAKCKTGDLLRCVVPFIPVGHAIGRLGCLFAGCCHGFAYDGFLAVYYPNSVAGLPADQGYFPVQLLEAVLNVGICVLLLRYEKRAKRSYDMLFAYLACYGVSRFCLEMLRGDGIRGIYFGLSTSQWISVGIWVACGIYFLLCRCKEQKEKA